MCDTYPPEQATEPNYGRNAAMGMVGASTLGQARVAVPDAPRPRLTDIPSMAGGVLNSLSNLQQQVNELMNRLGADWPAEAAPENHDGREAPVDIVAMQIREMERRIYNISIHLEALTARI